MKRIKYRVNSIKTNVVGSQFKYNRTLNLLSQNSLLRSARFIFLSTEQYQRRSRVSREPTHRGLTNVAHRYGESEHTKSRTVEQGGKQIYLKAANRGLRGFRLANKWLKQWVINVTAKFGADRWI